jgi:hypothetical protein
LVFWSLDPQFDQSLLALAAIISTSCQGTNQQKERCLLGISFVLPRHERESRTDCPPIRDREIWHPGPGVQFHPVTVPEVSTALRHSGYNLAALPGCGEGGIYRVVPLGDDGTYRSRQVMRPLFKS